MSRVDKISLLIVERCGVMWSSCTFAFSTDGLCHESDRHNTILCDWDFLRSSHTSSDSVNQIWTTHRWDKSWFFLVKFWHMENFPNSKKLKFLPNLKKNYLKWAENFFTKISRFVRVDNPVKLNLKIWALGRVEFFDRLPLGAVWQRICTM